MFVFVLVEFSSHPGPANSLHLLNTLCVCVVPLVGFEGCCFIFVPRQLMQMEVTVKGGRVSKVKPLQVKLVAATQ